MGGGPAAAAALTIADGSAVLLDGLDEGIGCRAGGHPRTCRGSRQAALSMPSTALAAEDSQAQPPTYQFLRLGRQLRTAPGQQLLQQAGSSRERPRAPESAAVSAATCESLAAPNCTQKPPAVPCKWPGRQAAGRGVAMTGPSSPLCASADCRVRPPHTVSAPVCCDRPVSLDSVHTFCYCAATLLQAPAALLVLPPSPSPKPPSNPAAARHPHLVRARAVLVLALPVRLPAVHCGVVGQVKGAAAVAGIHHRMQLHALRKWAGGRAGRRAASGCGTGRLSGREAGMPCGLESWQAPPQATRVPGCAAEVPGRRDRASCQPNRRHN